MPDAPTPKPVLTPAEKLARLIAEQGVRPVERFEDLLGRGRDLWETDEEFQEFLEAIRRAREERR
jgi:uncharacterized protein (DUF2384 family)